MKRTTANLRCGSCVDSFRLPRQSPGAQPPNAFQYYPPPSAKFAAVRVREVASLLKAVQPVSLRGCDSGMICVH